MSEKPNMLYFMSGGGTPVISATAYGVMDQARNYRGSELGTVYAAIGGPRGVLNEEFLDIFKWMDEGGDDAEQMLNSIKFPSWPIFGTSRYKAKSPDALEADNERIVEVCKAHNIKYILTNGGNDSMEKAAIISDYAQRMGYEIKVIGVPKTVDNDLLVTHRCPGYATFAKQVAIATMGLDGDMNSFAVNGYKNGKIKEGGVAQVLGVMGRDQGWGAAASVLGKYSEECAPHIVMTKDGKFELTKFLDKCQNTWDKYGKLMIVTSEGADDDETYLGNYVDIGLSMNEIEAKFKTHVDPHKNTNLSDSRVSLFYKMLLENQLKIDTKVYKSFKCREEGPGYRDRNDFVVLSEPDFKDAIAVGRRAVDLILSNGERSTGQMVTLEEGVGDTGYTSLLNVANPETGSKNMVKSMDTLSIPGRHIMGPDGMMIDKELFTDYIGEYVDIDGRNRPEILRSEGFRMTEVPRGTPSPNVEKLLPAYA
jgi:6-phosphofructokinase